MKTTFPTWSATFLLLFCVSPLRAETLNILYTHENRNFGTLLESYANERDVEIKATWIDQAELKSRIVTISSANDLPDLLVMPSDSLGMAAGHVFAAIPDDFLTIKASPKVLSTVTINGEILGIPLIQGNHLILYYNKSLVQTPAKNWQELVTQKSFLPDKVSLIEWSFMEMYWFIPFITAYGDLPVLKEQPNLDTESMRNALKLVWQLANDGIVDSRCDYNCLDNQFLNAQVAYVINGIWAYENYRQKLGDDLGVTQLPMIDDHLMKPYFSTIVAALPNDSLSSQKKALVKEFTQYIQSKSFQRKLWTTLNEIPAHEDILVEMRTQSDSDMSALVAMLDSTLPLSSHRNMGVIWEAILKGYMRYGSGIWTAERTTAYMQQIALDYISRLETESR